jgi:hypothetical protein
MSHSFKRTLRWTSLGALVIAGVLFVPSYEQYVTSRLANALDAQHGKTGWVVYWTAADAQRGQRIHLLRTLYVRFVYPRLLTYTPWKTLQFTGRSTSERYCHYVVCVLSEGREVTYFWSIRQNQWVVLWDNHVRDFPRQVQQEYAQKLRGIERRGGLNWPNSQTGKI